jgi:hypothetical protein
MAKPHLHLACLVTKSSDAWEPDAILLDRETPMFADDKKVHAVTAS